MYFQILIRRYHEIPLLIYENWNEISYLHDNAQYPQTESEPIPTDSKVYGGLSLVSSDESSKNSRRQSISLEAESRFVLFICLFIYVFSAKLVYTSFGHVFCVINKEFYAPLVWSPKFYFHFF